MGSLLYLHPPLTHYVRDVLCAVLQDSVVPTFEAVSTLRLAQVRNLLARSTCGTARVQHLLQTIRPSITLPLTNRVDLLTKQSITSTMGIGADDLDFFSYKQSCLPIRFGGLGYRASKDIVHEAFVAGFASSAYSS
jgi:hypothetical protein